MIQKTQSLHIQVLVASGDNDTHLKVEAYLLDYRIRS